MNRLYALLALSAILTACHPRTGSAPGVSPAAEASPAPETTATEPESARWTRSFIEASVVKGTLTQEELMKRLGAPNSMTPNEYYLPPEKRKAVAAALPPVASTTRYWNYWKPVEGSSDKVLRATFFIDDRGIVVDYVVTESRVTAP